MSGAKVIYVSSAFSSGCCFGHFYFSFSHLPLYSALGWDASGCWREARVYVCLCEFGEVGSNGDSADRGMKVWGTRASSTYFPIKLLKCGRKTANMGAAPVGAGSRRRTTYSV